jgi:hypothetical protein
MIGELLDWMLGEWVVRVLIACWRLEIGAESVRVGYVDPLMVCGNVHPEMDVSTRLRAVFVLL